MNDEKFDHLFDRCLEQLAQGVELEELLKHYPDEAPELRPLLNLALSLRIDSVPQPSQSSKIAGEQRLLNSITNKKSRNFILIPVSVSGGFRYIGQKLVSIQQTLYQFLEVLMLKKAFATILLLAVIFSMGGAFTAFASQEALPGEFLYSVKTAIEDTRLTFTFDNASWGRLSLALANARLQEIEQLLKSGKVDAIPLALQRLETHIQATQTAAAALQNARPEEAQSLLHDLAGLIQQGMQQILAGVNEANQAASQQVLEALQGYLLAITQSFPVPGSDNTANDNQSNTNLNQNTNSNVNANDNANLNQNANDNNQNSNTNANDNGDNANDNDDKGGNSNSNDNEDNSNDNGNNANDNDDKGGSSNSNDNDDNSNDNGNNSNDNDDKGGNSNSNDNDNKGGMTTDMMIRV